MVKFSGGTWALALAALLTLAACGPRPSDSAYLGRGGPQSLLDVSSEVVNLSIGSKKDVDALGKWVAADAPNRADVQCNLSSKTCKDTIKLLERHGVEVTAASSPEQTVTLTYERILARDCNQRYREPESQYYNAAHAAHGCAIAANIVQHVSDKNVFVNPGTMDVPRAVSAVSAIGRMSADRTAPSAYGVEQSVVGSAQTQ